MSNAGIKPEAIEHCILCHRNTTDKLYLIALVDDLRRIKPIHIVCLEGIQSAD